MRDPKALAEASKQAVSEGAWPVRYASEDDGAALRRIFNQYRQRPEEYIAGTVPKQWTATRARTFADRFHHPLVVEHNSVVGFLGVREADTDQGWMGVADCCPVDLTLDQRDNIRALLSLAATLLLFLRAKGVPLVRIIVAPGSRIAPWADQIVTPEHVGRHVETGETGQLVYTDTVNHALHLVGRFLEARAA